MGFKEISKEKGQERRGRETIKKNQTKTKPKIMGYIHIEKLLSYITADS